MNKITTAKVQRVSKPSARKLYNKGVEIYITPCKISPENCWGIGSWHTKDLSVDFDEDFDILVRDFTWYNCQYEDWGRYPAFYVRKEDLA